MVTEQKIPSVETSHQILGDINLQMQAHYRKNGKNYLCAVNIMGDTRK
jgi:hypothetical protein